MSAHQNYTAAAWAAVFSAVLTVPLVCLSMLSGFMEAFSSGILIGLITNFVSIISSALTIYIFIALKNLFSHKIFGGLVWAVIVLLVLLELSSVVELIVVESNMLVALFVMVLSILMGIISIAMGLIILRVDKELSAPFTSYAYLSIASGIVTVTIILLFILPILSIVSDAILAIAFFKLAGSTDADKK